MPRTSAAGIAQLVADEGEVLTAYRDVAGVWTIGVGLTQASGVVTPKAGMTITRAESRHLLGLALERNYEPAVAKAMPGAKTHEFDGGLSFHFNTGAIGKASWVTSWRNRASAAAIRTGLGLWNKAGGRVVRGLTLRRQREADLILLGKYAHGITPAVRDGADVEPGPIEPSGVLRRGAKGEGVVELQKGLQTLGLYKGAIDGDFGAGTEVAVRALQKAHPHLVVDGIAGPATRAQLKRMLDAATKSGLVGAGGAGTGGGTAIAPVDGLPTGWIVGGVAAVTLLVLAFLAWRYRDEIRTWWTVFKEKL
ncbi:glycoside hydrolase family protein [Terrihabitans sp. B22-R8]|uniref:glycoside hydrolase family protein n=1 Tax=Terrihabitans sp. B22-R8 TaxID=3425128 RepID=UPI00403C3FD3